MENVVAAITVTAVVNAKKTVNGVTVQGVENYSHTLSFASGTGLNECNAAYITKGVAIAASSALALDVRGGLSSMFGDTLAMTAIKFIMVVNKSANSATIVDLGGGSNPVPFLKDAASDKIPIKQNGVALVGTGLAAGQGATAAGTADVVTITNTDGTNQATVDVIVLGIE